MSSPIALYGWACALCKCTFRLEEDPSERGENAKNVLLTPSEQRFVCPCCDSNSGLRPMIRPLENPTHSLFPHEAWNAFNGMGLPVGHSPSEEEVTRLLVEVGVESVVSTTSSSGRCEISCVVCKDGTRMHFTISGYGVCVHKLTRKEE